MAKKATASAPVLDKAAQIDALTAMLNGSTATTTPKPVDGDFQKKAASRATSNLMVSMGVLAFPVKIYKATDTDTVNYNQLHDACGTRLKQQAMFCPTCNEAVEKDHIHKGFEYEKGKYVTVTAEEIEGCKAAADDQLTVECFVEASSIDPIYFESTYFVGPDKGAELQFALLRAGMVAKGKVAIAHYALKGREQTVVIRPYGERGLTLHYLYFDYEVRSFAGWDKVPNTDALAPKFVEVASQLVETMTEDFAPETYSDSYLVNTRAMLNAKAAGNAAPVVAKVAKADPSTDLLAALAASLDGAKAKKASKKAA